MSDYIKRENAIRAVGAFIGLNEDERQWAIEDIPSADVIEVGKAYPREEFEKYGLSEWKDKDGQRWVMIEWRS